MGIESDDSCRPAVRAENGRLPEMKLPQFSGKVLEFTTFWAQFEASIHNRSDMDAATKFTYLISTTEGRARSSIEAHCSQLPAGRKYSQGPLWPAKNGGARTPNGTVEVASVQRHVDAWHPITCG
ncbi:hypothetical protein T05_14128 [Trichinella murrelli]|uniref:Uncharacterized protein n=1 Tax=Trichinella murrelli TaxID=144512 RepID=A0A0V0T135_9BILA|nr:hypothetical protein T05_14128 [Trichinella murrelli]